MARAPSKTERWVGAGILVVLVVIVIGVILEQFQFSAAILPTEVLAQYTSARKQTSTSGDAFSLAILPSGLRTAGALEEFNAENLSDKIDGKADLYLDAGFVGMQCQRFALRSKSEASFEAFVYDMGTPRNAFAVFSSQRRDGAAKLSLGDFGYRTRDALFFSNGCYYVEIIAATEDKDTMDAMLGFAQEFVSKTETSREPIRELALFPADRLRDNSFILLAKDAFGFAGFDNVFTATYNIEGQEVTVFLTVRKSVDEAEKLAKSYCDFLTANGGNNVSMEKLPPLRLVELMGDHEVFFSDGKIVAGVHAVASKETALRFAISLKQYLVGASE